MIIQRQETVEMGVFMAPCGMHNNFDWVGFRYQNEFYTGCVGEDDDGDDPSDGGIWDVNPMPEVDTNTYLRSIIGGNGRFGQWGEMPRYMMDHEVSDVLRRVREIVGSITYKHWVFVVEEMDTGTYVQAVFVARCATTKRPDIQKGRKWYVSSHATETEIVSTAWLAVQTAEIHEARENFVYKGKKPYGPHTSVGALAKASDEREHRAPKKQPG